jgi:hypothetical protein
MLSNTISKMMLITPNKRTASITIAPKKIAQQNRCKKLRLNAQLAERLRAKRRPRGASTHSLLGV